MTDETGLYLRGICLPRQLANLDAGLGGTVVTVALELSACDAPRHAWHVGDVVVARCPLAEDDPGHEHVFVVTAS